MPRKGCVHSPGKTDATDSRRVPEPFSAVSTVRGRPDEVLAMLDDLQERIEEIGWKVESAVDGRAPARAVRFARDGQWLTLTACAAPADRLTLPHEMDLSATGLVVDGVALQKVVTALPFTPLELELIAGDMPLTAATPRRIREWIPSLELPSKPLAGHAAVFTIHHQTDFVLMLEMALELGLDPGVVTVIDKEYRYRHAQRVDAYIRRHLGIHVFRYAEVDRGITDHLHRIEAASARSSSTAQVPTIVVDDGGYVLPRLLEGFADRLSSFSGVVEQTTSGIWALRPFQSDLAVPIFSVAQSKLKASVEAQGVAQASLTSLRRLLPQENFNGRAAVVVGYGTVGTALADLLRRQNVRVHVADEDASMVVAAREQGFDAQSDVPDLIRRVQPRYVFSCAGRDAVGRDCVEAIAHDCFLISLTSRDYAFDKQALADLATPSSRGTLGTMYAKNAPACAMLLVADGFPVNFHYAESMPNQQSDLVMASLLVGLVTLACSLPQWPPGNDHERADGILAAGTLLDDYLSCRHDFEAFEVLA
jgi:adenosylhomocysteinase